MATTFMERMAEDAKKRRQRVVELRVKRLTFEEIGRVMGLSKANTWRLWKDAKVRGEIAFLPRQGRVALAGDAVVTKAERNDNHN